jgi:DoxX-like family
MMIGSAVGKLLKPAAALKSFAEFGYPESFILAIGILEIACTIVCLIPGTSVLGAILVTGYLGGATATNVRVGNPAFVAPIVFGVLAWVGLFLREDRLRTLIPLRSPKSS